MKIISRVGVVLVAVCLALFAARAAHAQSCIPGCQPNTCNLWLDCRTGQEIDCGDPCHASGLECDSHNLCCAPDTCQSEGDSCGSTNDGCAFNLDCGSCAAGQICTGGFLNSKGEETGLHCVQCTPQCAGRVCGAGVDSCNRTISCGVCRVGETCDGTSCLCGSGPACAPGQFCVSGSCSSRPPPVPAVPAPALAGLSIGLLALGLALLTKKRT
jgi:hypothetical protein